MLTAETMGPICAVLVWPLWSC